MDLQVREAAGADLGQVVQLWRDAGVTRPWNDPDTDFVQAHQGPTSTILVGEDSTGQLVATAMVGVDGHRGWIYYFPVQPRARRSGHGGQLLAECERWLAGAGARKVQLMVREGNEAAGFYSRHGYTDQRTTVLGRWLGADHG